MSISYTTKCPRCKSPLQVNEGPVGRSISCPLCRHHFRLDSFQAAKPDSDPTTAFAETRDNSEESQDSDILPPRSLGRFRLKRVLGEGGFGRVYLAYDPHLDRLVALKVPLFGPEDKKRSERFLKEARAASRLRHSAIVPAYECDQVDGCLYIVFEYVEGVPLSTRIRDGRVERIQAVEWVRDLADALAFAHANRVIHRDIKPHNILINTRERPFIMDFGLVRWLDEESALTKAGSWIGTIPYMAPELIGSSEPEIVTPAVDQYSLGVVFYELLTGHRTFEGPSSTVVGRMVTQRPPRPSLHDPTIPIDLEAICLKAIQREPQYRYEDCAALANALTRWLTEQSKKVRPDHHRRGWISGLQQSINSWLPRKELWLCVSLPLLLLPVAVIIYAWPQPILVPSLPETPQTVNLPSSTTSVVRECQQAWATFQGVEVEMTYGIGMRFCLVPPGEFLMGTPVEERDEVQGQRCPTKVVEKIRDQEKAHKVRISESFFMSQFEVTQAQYETLMKRNPSRWKGVDNPVETVSWNNAVEFCKTLSSLQEEREAGHRYRLPTEAEWELACRAGFSSSDSNVIKHSEPETLPTNPVGSESPNELGLHNMLGNVSEWCWDFFGKDTYKQNPGLVTDPTGPRDGEMHAVRGGSLASREWFRRPGHRDSAAPTSCDPHCGFRIVLEIAK